MILSHLHRFIFLKTRKTAGTSIEIALSSICGPDDIITPVRPKDEAIRVGNGPRNHTIPFFKRTVSGMAKSAIGIAHKHDRRLYNHIPAFELRRHIDDETWSTYFKFTVERNPWDQLVSYYHWIYRAERAGPNPPDFSQFVKNLVNSPEPRNFEIYSIDNMPIVDFIIRFEHLSEDYATAMSKLGINQPPPLAQAKTGARPQKDWREYYDSETRELVEQVYAPEIKLMGYEF